VAKKPQQTKRLRNTKTSKKFAKKNPLSNWLSIIVLL
jgi:hypothetical protein